MKEYRDVIDKLAALEGEWEEKRTYNGEALLKKFDLDKIMKTIDLLWRFMTLVGDILIVDDSIKPVKWYNFKSLFSLAKVTYEFVKSVIDIWK